MDRDSDQKVPSGAKKFPENYLFCPPAPARVVTRWTKWHGRQHFKNQKSRIIGTF